VSETWSIVKAAVIALIVAMLIWIWAEGESLTRRQTDSVEVRFPADPDSDLVIRPDDPNWNGSVRITLEGSVRRVDRAINAIGNEIRLAAALEGMPTKPAVQVPLRLRDLISKLPALADAAGVVAEVSPAEVLVTVERMVTRTMPVRVELASPAPLDGQPVVTPPTVDVRLSEALAAELPADAAVVATVTEEQMARLRSEGPQTLRLSVRLPVARNGAAARVTMKPETVSAIVRLKLAIDTIKVPTVPVWFSLPPTEDGGKWNIEILDKFLTDVTVSGPSEDVQRVRSGQTAVKAMIEFTSDELERAANAPSPSVITKQAVCAGLPPGLTCGIANAAVKVRVSRRDPPR
jgi:YbbR domain-containing protein